MEFKGYKSDLSGEMIEPGHRLQVQIIVRGTTTDKSVSINKDVSFDIADDELDGLMANALPNGFVLKERSARGRAAHNQKVAAQSGAKKKG